MQSPSNPHTVPPLAPTPVPLQLIKPVQVSTLAELLDAGKKTIGDLKTLWNLSYRPVAERRSNPINLTAAQMYLLGQELGIAPTSIFELVINQLVSMRLEAQQTGQAEEPVGLPAPEEPTHKMPPVKTLAELIDQNLENWGSFVALKKLWNLNYRTVADRKKNPVKVTAAEIYLLAQDMSISAVDVFTLVVNELVAKGELSKAS